MKRKLSNDRALRILAAARREFARAGFDSARVDRIAAAAGTNKQLLYYYFRSKRGLFQVVLQQAAADLEGALEGPGAPGGPPIARLRAALLAQFDYLARHPDLVVLLTHAARGDRPVFAPAVRRLVVLLAEGQGRGHVRGDLDPHIAAAQALVLMVGYLRLEPLIAGAAPTLAAGAPALRAKWMGSAVELFVAGVRADAA